MRSVVRLLAVLIATLAASAASAADIKVMISAGFFSVYKELGPAFEKATGHTLVTTRGPSLGDLPEAIPTRLARGEHADVVIMDGHGTDILETRDMIASRMPLAESFIGMVVRAGQPKPDISTVEALRKTLLAAKSIAYSDSIERHVSVDRRIQEARRRRRDRRQDAQGARSAVGRAGGGGRRARRGGDRLPAGRRADPCARHRFRRHGAGRHSAADLFRRRTAEGFAKSGRGGRAAALPLVCGSRSRHHQSRIEAAGAVSRRLTQRARHRVPGSAPASGAAATPSRCRSARGARDTGARSPAACGSASCAPRNRRAASRREGRAAPAPRSPSRAGGARGDC